jgi:tripartite-type tricarboxylate transporter receptor subunit TctC
MAEACLPDFDASIWFGLMAPAGTPRPIITRLAGAVNEALKSDELKASYAAQGFDLLGGGPQEFASTIANDTERWTVAARAAGLKK